MKVFSERRFRRDVDVMYMAILLFFAVKTILWFIVTDAMSTKESIDCGGDQKGMVASEK